MAVGVTQYIHSIYILSRGVGEGVYEYCCHENVCTGPSCNCRKVYAVSVT